MSPFSPYRVRPSAPAVAPLILLVEDDPSVAQVLQIALTQQHYRVVTAVDGDEALRRAAAERPDLVVCDVKLPRRGGLEVCDHLRHDPEDPNVPIILLSASGDTDARVEGLSRGADDYMAKPFSPKELIARVQRLLARASEARRVRQRAQELERELGHAQDDARRARTDLQREQRLRELAFSAGRELHRTLDLDELEERLLRDAQRQLACDAVMLLGADAGGETPRTLVPCAGRGDASERFARLTLALDGELAALLAGLARPVSRAELERFIELREELRPFIAAGVGWFAPLRGARGLEAVLVAGERTDARALGAHDRESLAALCEFAASALANAREHRAAQDHALEWLERQAVTREDVADATREAEQIAAHAAGVLALPARERGLLQHAVRFGAWGWGEACAQALGELERRDATRRIRSLRALMQRGETLEGGDDLPVNERHAMLVLGVSVRFLVGRVSGRSASESWETALAWAGPHLDARARTALEAAHDARFQHAA